MSYPAPLKARCTKKWQNQRLRAPSRSIYPGRTRTMGGMMSEALKEKPNAEPVPAISSAGIVVGGRYVPPPPDKDGKIWVRATALVQADPDRLYRMWRDVENAPRWQEQIVQVTRTGDATSHWTMRSRDKTIEWDSQ